MIVILDFFQSIFFVYTFEIKTNSWIWYIFITTLFYYLIFKVNLYKHHYLSIILIILLGLVIDLILGNLQNEVINNLKLLLMKFLREILVSLLNVFFKYTMEKKYVSVYEICFYIGIINVALFGIFALFDYYFFGLYEYTEYFNNFDFKELLVALGVTITQCGINLGSMITSKKNTPCHVFIIFVFGQFFYYINFSVNSTIIIILLIFILFLALIFNEIIEINCFGLSHNTKRNIINRAETEDLSILGSETNIEEFKVENDGYLIELENDEKFGDNE